MAGSVDWAGRLPRWAKDTSRFALYIASHKGHSDVVRAILASNKVGTSASATYEFLAYARPLPIVRGWKY